jgi:ribose/xylose/arabinose/galactoside ABC-type transport system permease subunit
MTTRTLLSILLAVVVVAARAGVALAQCAMCGNSFAQNDPTIDAFNSSVLFLIAAPYTVFLTAAGCVVFLYRRSTFGRRATIIPFRGPSVDDPKEVTP